ncbi:membrane protein insertase YidC [candidate division WOR-3 bacterium]|uniref:Membrane protein insertase YidC n=1 Tax=candidate division WOR-3 bacterium TaxID=2052148 RepID=A0A937XJG1_UNCW3|nr:membrane protein insertase YidC [candidate division WOR-3 bacterium]
MRNDQQTSSTTTTIIGFVLVAAILILSQIFLRPRATPPQQAAAPTQQTQPQAAQPVQAGQSDVPVLQPVQAQSLVPLAAEPAAESIVTLENELVRLEFTSVGGAVRSVWMKKYQVEVVPQGRNLLGTAVELPQGWVSTASTPMQVTRNDSSVTFTARSDSLILTKTFSLGKDYTLDHRVSVAGPARGFAVDGMAGLALTEKNPKAELIHFHFYAHVGKKLQQTPAGKLKNPQGKCDTAEWVGVKSRYFLLAVIACDRTFDSTYAVSVDSGRLGFSAVVKNPSPETQFTVYLGPLEHARLRAFGLGLDNVIGLGWTRPLAVAMLWFLRLLYTIVRNWGLAIIVFAILMKLAFYPLTRTQTKQMRQMQLLQPKISELKVKYKNDAQKLNAETMQLYKLYKINPASGCLPLLVQMPVFWALYAVLSNAIELRGAAFVFWLKDMSVPDALFGHLPQGLPMVGGAAIGLVPILMGASSIVQTLITSADKKNLAMTIIMPVFITLIFLNMPSGLQLYWFMYNVLSIGESLIAMKGGMPWSKPKSRREPSLATAPPPK